MEKCRHVAVIMDGNGRWAKAHGLPRYAGHMAGADNVRTIAIAADEEGVEYLTLYAFSTENWKRSAEEVSYLMGLPAVFFKKYMREFLARGFRFRFIGNLAALPEATRKVLEEAEEESGDNSGLTLIIAMNYGSRDEITSAVRKYTAAVLAGAEDPAQLCEDKLQTYLFTRGVPDVDLLIRTGNEQRLSNYLLWQSAYAELEFVPQAWPEFTPDDLRKCIEEYYHRDRRYGGRHE